MNILTPVFNSYAQSFLLHQRCACHIINLIVKCGLKRLEGLISNFRTAISFLNASNQRIASYKQYCIALGQRPRKFNVDMPVRWNSTYMMLKSIVPHIATFSVFINTNYPRHDGTQLLTARHWEVAEKLLSFLELFYDSTVALSGIYYPTSPLIVHHILEIATQMKTYENDEVLRPAVVAMKSKYLKYWREIPVLYAFAFILDPRAKLSGFGNVLGLISDAVGVDYSAYFTNIRDKLTEVYGKYDQKFAGVRCQRPPPAPTTGKKKQTWGKIFGGSSSTRTNTSSTSTPTVLQGGGELATYLNSDNVRYEEQMGEDFNILQ